MRWGDYEMGRLGDGEGEIRDFSVLPASSPPCDPSSSPLRDPRQDVGWAELVCLFRSAPLFPLFRKLEEECDAEPGECRDMSLTWRRESTFHHFVNSALVLYDAEGSPCARRVRIVLLEKGLAWETRLLDLTKMEQKRPEYLALNPNGIVPTLVHGDRVIYESNVITEYLDEIFPSPRLYPEDPWQRAQATVSPRTVFLLCR